ncbi:PRC-barrel domain-containing protein [Erythrobacter sanguineus]|uniref:PRC-barrel domain-containing protein n=1 Tax=Erythrobacter sanguineus TaxID=198312 RepID=A0A1M7SYD0_9SPHN|nr:PRC-barrel domain-containing protein [Erythrobacter sanguineus]SHN63535.1 PRC-barrel domain-containing protein [Erythrobacter sanguineus]
MMNPSDKHHSVSPDARNPQEHGTGPINDPDHELIASDRVEGTKVFRPNGDRIGKIDHFMVNKRSGQVEYALMSFGGFLGLGEELRPLPRDALEYDSEQEGYVVAAEDDVFRNSPFIEGGTAPAWDSAYARTLYGYWGVPY